MKARATICAIATAPGAAGVGVVRVSGAAVPQVIEAVIGKPLAPRAATLAAFRDADGSAIDSGIAIYFAAPHSYTGEDVLELQGHGGTVVQNLLLRRCIALGCRLAEPGEFTRRAYLNDKIDLVEAESVADLIAAQSAQAARAAMRSLSGEFSRTVGELSAEMVALRMLVEATLDFPEEEVGFLRREHAWERLEALQASARRRWSARAARGAAQRRPLGGAGRSAQRRQIVADERAGRGGRGDRRRRPRHHPRPHRKGGRRRRPAAAHHRHGGPARHRGRSRAPGHRAHPRGDRARRPGAAPDRGGQPRRPGRRRHPRQPAAGDRTPGGGQQDQTWSASSPARADGAIRLSAKTGAGLELLRAELKRLAGLDGAAEDAILARERHLEALREARAHLVLAAGHAGPGALALELFAEELRLAHEALAAITGEFSADDLLGEIFSRFCIGK